MKLRFKLWMDGRIVYFKILDQPDRYHVTWRRPNFMTVECVACPQLCNSVIYLRGSGNESDYTVSKHIHDTINGAKDYINDVYNTLIAWGSAGTGNKFYEDEEETAPASLTYQEETIYEV